MTKAESTRRELIKQFERSYWIGSRNSSKGADFISIKDRINIQTATSRFTLNIFASLAEFERELIRERTMAGLSAAKARGRMGERPKGLSKKAMDKAHSALLLYNSKRKTIEEIAEELGLSRATCYRYIEVAKELEVQKQKRLRN